VSIPILILFLAILVVSYWAATQIITRAGYSSAWILAPLAPLVLTVAAFIKLYIDLRSIPYALPFGVDWTSYISGLSAVGILWTIDVFALFANWILFLIFAFTRWPAALAAGAGPRSSAPLPSSGGDLPSGRKFPGRPRSPGDSVLSTTTPSPGDSPWSPRSATGESTRNVPTTNASAAPAAGVVRGKYCVWCGESLPGSRALFHECGPRDRPATNCVTCGAVLPGEGVPCPACNVGG
jgi:hypothetical protein